MASKRSGFLAMFVVLALFVTLLSGCFGSGGNEATPTGTSSESKNEPSPSSEAAKETKTGAPTVIVFGTHWQQGDDPEWKDPVTGAPGMAPDQLLARQKAQEAVLKELNVQIKWIQYPSDVREALLKSVLANDPICDVCLLWGGSQGTLLGQNIFQPLDEYQSIFSDPDNAWMFGDKMFGHNYFLNYILDFVNTWPLVYNIAYLDKVDALKENGQTVYPVDLWKQGKWTWSAFEDYLTKVNAYYANKKAPVRTDVPIKAFQTDYRYTAQQAIHSNGGAVYGANGLTADAPEAKKAVEYIDGLMTKGLMMSVRYGDDTSVPGWTWNGSDFGNGETVFTNMVPWLSTGAGQTLAGRGESMGVVPFPRPDNIAADDPKYEQVVFPGNQMAVLKGISKEKTELALKAYQLYWSTAYKTLASSDKALDFFTKQAKNTAISYGYDVTNEKLGANMMEAFTAIAGSKPNEYSSIMPWANLWSDTILGNSIYGLNGSPKYAAAIDAQKNLILESMSSTEKALSSGKFIDNIPPSFTETGTPIAVAAGTDPSSIQWDTFVKAQDAVDGDIAFTNVKVDTSAVTFNKVGKYDNGLAVSAKDAAGNEGKKSFTVFVYDPKNKTAPTIKAKEGYRAIKVNEDASKINWANDFVDQAADKDGFDLKSKITADIGELDVTTPGKYEVTLTVTDFAGNKADLKITVTVE
ncbi:hypothetical protein GE107_06865 [Cohnella sp. CFH 77786]|uniref:immunoglobulin-like domain-containing protein n=1 Tax=Cohnella sp. CFH 77786 TaxID=2662265 RepID=UPI001C60B1F5|nr:immunoglobulin-like domain-containing protein [Cohnella sp. CFH 77786]MBW5445781.1 hypothetical protein [Cohnella sp. CFH 77786]